MTIDELMHRIEKGERIFLGAGNRKRIVINAGWAWIQYQVPSQPNTIKFMFTKEFAKWAKVESVKEGNE